MSFGRGRVGSVRDDGICDVVVDAVSVDERVVDEGDVNEACLESLRGIS